MSSASPFCGPVFVALRLQTKDSPSMHAQLRAVALLLLGSTAWACSSSDSPSAGKADGGGTGGGGAASGGKQGSGGAKSAGGGTARGGSSSGAGGAVGTHCAADAGADACRACLAGACCDTFIECLGQAVCSSALSAHEACFRKLGAEPSACFGDLSRALQGEAGPAAGFPPLGACIITNCQQVCGGPNAI
jgi:hypothetical protein